MKSDHSEKILQLLQNYDMVKHDKRLLMVSFTSLSDYMWYLRSICQRLGGMGSRVMLYLAAAVSDFYIPSSEMPEHKIQSSGGAPKLQLQLVPKMLHPLVKFWVPNAFVVSFKLETDPGLLETKARKALETYQHQMVIGNLLHDRKRKVSVIERSCDSRNKSSKPTEIELSDQELEDGMEIEQKIVSLLSDVHGNYRRHD